MSPDPAQHKQTIQTFQQLNGELSDILKYGGSLQLGSELSLLGEIVNFAGSYSRGMKVNKIENLLPDQLNRVEKDLSERHGCIETSFIHVERACFQRVKRAEAEFVREERAAEHEKLAALRIEGTAARPLIENAIILPGLSSQKLAFRIAAEAGVPIGSMDIVDFANTEMKVSINQSVRGKRVFIVQSVGYDAPRHLMTLKLIMNAALHAGADEINLVLPSFPFARQDRKPSHVRGPISAEVVASDLVNEGMTRMITLEIHAQQIVGFFGKRPVDNLLAIPLATREAINAYRNDNLVVAFPDQGMAKRAKDDGHIHIINSQIGRSVPKIEMRKDRPEDNVAGEIEILGDTKVIEGATVLLLDDMIDTGGTTIASAAALKQNGAAKVVAISAHGVLSLDGAEKLKSATTEVGGLIVPVLDAVYITDSLPLYKSPRNTETGAKVIHTISCAPLLGEAVRRIGEKNGDSLRALWRDQTFYRTGTSAAN